MMNGLAVRFDFPNGLEETSRFLDGHFPGNPIVPGAILIGLAEQSLREVGYEIENVLRMKFLRPLHPSQPFEITYTQEKSACVLRWLCDGQAIARARVRLRSIHD